MVTSLHSLLWQAVVDCYVGQIRSYGVTGSAVLYQNYKWKKNSALFLRFCVTKTTAIYINLYKGKRLSSTLRGSYYESLNVNLTGDHLYETTEEYFPVITFISLYKVALTIVVYYVVQGDSDF